MKVSIVALLILLNSACSTRGPVYAWYHPLGGEYLFAFDQRECESLKRAQNADLHTGTEAPFFQCMRSRGYTLLTADAGLEVGALEALLANGE